MTETRVRSAEEIRADWLSLAAFPKTTRDEKGPDQVGQEIIYLTIQAEMQMMTEQLGLAPFGKETIAGMTALTLRPPPVFPIPTPQEMAYADPIDELLRGGMAGKFAETLIASIANAALRDNIARLLVVKLVEAGKLPRARTAVKSLDFADDTTRFHAAILLAHASKASEDVDLARSLLAPLKASGDAGKMVFAYLDIYSLTGFHGDWQMAKAAADAPQPLQKARAFQCLAIATADVGVASTMWQALMAAEQGEKKTLLVFGMLDVIACWAFGMRGLPRLDKECVEQMIAAIPVKNWRDHLIASIQRATERVVAKSPARS